MKICEKYVRKKSFKITSDAYKSYHSYFTIKGFFYVNLRDSIVSKSILDSVKRFEEILKFSEVCLKYFEIIKKFLRSKRKF